jgi:hypothetical protein
MFKPAGGKGQNTKTGWYIRRVTAKDITWKNMSMHDNTYTQAPNYVLPISGLVISEVHKNMCCMLCPGASPL